MFLSHACALLFLSGLIPLQEQAETDQVSSKFLSRIDQAIEEAKWEPLFLLYEEALERHRYRVAPDPKIEGIQVGMVEYLVRRYASLPKEAFEVYRNMRDAHAEQALESALQEEDSIALDRALSLYFFASMSDTYLDRFARYLQERGRYNDALLYWNRLLRFYPDSDIPKEVVLARMAVSCQLAGDASQLSQLKKFSQKSLGERLIWIGRNKKKLSHFLDSIEIAPFSEKLTNALPVPMATRVPQQGEPRYVRNDLLWWSYDFAADEESKKSVPNTSRFRPPGRTSSLSDYPLRPAYGRWKGKPYVIFTNGYKVVAVNPERVREGNLVKGVYWTFPEKGSLKVPSPPRTFGIQYQRPYIGVTIKGEYAYVTLYSSTRVAPNNRDFFSGPTRLTCFHLPTGKRVWDTEGLYDATQKMERREQQSYDFLDQNFAFSGPPLIRDDQLFIGICTSPAGEQISRVLCLDSRTGAPKWCTFIASFTQPGNRFGRSSMNVSPFLPMMVEEGGVLFVQTSLGVVGAIRATTGGVLWLSRYNRDIRVPNWNSQSSVNIRPANEPVLSQGRVWILPQDSNELLAFDQQSGAPISLPRAVAKTGVVPWPEMKWLLGVVDDWMILGGVSSYVLRLSDFRAHSLASANTSGCGRGQIVGEDVYLSIQAGGKGALGLYAGLGSWRKIRTPDWKGEKQKGNLLLAGSTLVVSTDKIYFYTDAATVRRRFASRIKQSPPDLKSLLDYAALMDSGGIWKEAVEAYLEYDRMTKGTEPPSTTVRDRLHELFLKIGEDLDNSSLTSKLRYFQQARKFAPSSRKKAHIEWKMSELLYEMGRNREAIDLCRKMRDLYPDYIFSVRGGETSVRVREFASHLISKIQEKDPGAYRHVETVAKQALKEVQEDRFRGWRKVGTLFPNSQAAKEARRLLLEELLGQEEWEKALGLLRETSLPSDPRPIFQLLERLGDRQRLVSALQDWRLQFGDTVLVTKGNTSPVHEIAGQWLQRIAENSLPQKDLPDGALSQVGQTLEKEGILPLSPLHPQGLVPPMFPEEGALLQLGSSVELRDIHDGSRKWRVNHPFGYSGIRMQGNKGTFSVRSVDQDSPAARAGILSGDLIEELNGVPTTSFLVSRFLRAGILGSLVSMKVKRKESLLDISFTLGTIPPDKGAPVIGAAYTQGYSLAIVWPEVVVAVNVRSGVQEWIFTTEGGRFSIQGMKGGEGTLLLGGNEAGKSRLVCLEDRTGAVRWIRNYPLAQSVSQKVTLSSFYQDEAISVLQFSPSGKSVLRIFDRKTGEPLSKEVLFPQGILSHSVDEAAGVFHVLQGLSGRNRQLRGISLRGKTVGQDLYLITLSPNQIGTDVRGSQIFARDSHLVLMIPSGVQRRKSGVYVFDLRKKRFAYSISLPQEREWSKGMCEGVPIDLDGVLYLYSETMASEPGNRTGFVGAYVLGETPQLQWEAVAPTLPFSSSARWTLDTEMKNHLLFLTPDGGVPGEKGDRPVAALYSKTRGGYLEQVFSDLDDRLKGKVFSRSPGRLLFSTSVGIKGYGSP